MAAPRLLTQTFDEIAEGAFVTIHNPLWLTIERTTPPEMTGDKENRRRQAAEWILGFVTEWAIPVLGENDEPQLLRDVSVESLLRAPGRIERWMVGEIRDAANPL